MGLEAILGLLGGAGLGSSANMPLSPNAPSLDSLTLNPSVMGQAPPQIPYEYGQGPQPASEPMPPTSPPGGNPEGGKPEKTWQEGLTDFSKALMSISKAGSALQASPLAQRMFQETNQKQMIASQMHQGKIEEFRRKDLSSQILEKYGLL